MDPRDALIDVGRFAHSRGWVPATSGNLSARIDGERLWMTRSGGHTGELTRESFLEVDLHGRPLGAGRPSAETALHALVYRQRPEVGAVVHTHSPSATVLSMPGEPLLFEGYEILKAFHGIDTHETRVRLEVFANHQDMDALADTVAPWLAASPEAQGFLLAGHGLYTWGPTVACARRHLEAWEFLFTCLLSRPR